MTNQSDKYTIVKTFSNENKQVEILHYLSCHLIDKGINEEYIQEFDRDYVNIFGSFLNEREYIFTRISRM